MTSSRIPPIPPDKDSKTVASQHRKIEKIEKIQKASEIDDESRSRKFREMVEAEPEDNSESTRLPTLFDLVTSKPERSSPPPPSSPAPFMETDAKWEKMADSAIPSPSYSPPPSVFLSALPAEEEESSLPQSRDIWSMLDEPPDAPTQGPVFQENTDRSVLPNEDWEPRPRKEASDSSSAKTTPQSAPQETGKTKKRASGVPEEVETQNNKPSPLELPGKSMVSEKKPTMKKASTPLPMKIEKSPISQETADANNLEEEKPLGVSIALTPQEKKLKGTLAKEQQPSSLKRPVSPDRQPISRSLTKEEEKKIQNTDQTLLKKGAGQSKKGEKGSVSLRQTEKDELFAGVKDKEEEEQKKREEIKELPQIQSPSVPSLPDTVIPAAQIAASQAAPYLGPETLSIYFHMIGTIVAMVAPSGDTRTEFILNAPSFANSKFFGSTITIEKFSTAPNSFNIRLTGSTDAVNAFNQNIPNLLAAFERGKFSFVIHRIDTAYEKHLFHRKESKKDKESDDDSKNRDR